MRLEGGVSNYLSTLRKSNTLLELVQGKESEIRLDDYVSRYGDLWRNWKLQNFLKNTYITESCEADFWSEGSKLNWDG